jgi:hypothetical protein
MSELIELSIKQHSKLKVVENCALSLAKKLHIINIRVNEIAQMASQCPVFFNKSPDTGHWGLSALTSFTPQHNLFVNNDTWLATYLPSSIQSYPFFLMKKPNGGEGYTLGFDGNSHNFSEKTGTALFDENGKATAYLSQIKNIVEADIQHDIQTYEFIDTLLGLNLLKAVNIIVNYQDGRAQTIKGLSVINEDALQVLSAEQLKSLQKSNYLPAIYASLVSLLQLNTLVRKHNEQQTDHITQIQIEVSRDAFVD